MTCEMGHDQLEAEPRRAAPAPLSRHQLQVRLAPGGEETRRLLQELQLHQIELEQQNAELRRARDEVEMALARSVAAERALSFSETRYRRLFETAKNGILILEADTGRITDANPSLCAFLGYEAEAVRGRELWEIGVFADAPASAEALGELRARGSFSRENLPLCARDGRPLVVDFLASVYQVDQKDVIQCDIRDVTSRARAEQELLKSEEQCRTIVNNINEYVYSVHFERGAVISIFHSPKCYDITGYSPEEYHEDPFLWITMVHPEDRELVTTFLNNVFAGKCCAPIRHRIRHKNGSERWLLNSCSVQMAPKGAHSAISRLDGFILDITELKLAEENVFFLAHHDPLTGLPNRSTLQVRIGQVLSVAQKAQRNIALLFLDIDDFKQINDSLGHDVGDRFLQSVAGRLKDCTRSCDIVARLGGDEFVMVLWDCGVEEATVVARKVVSAGFSIEGSSTAANTSIGISLFPQDGTDYLSLVKNADTAMYHAKKAGGKNFQFFTHKLNDLARERFTVESELRQALKLGEFVLHYQPKVNIVTGKSSGMEALIRWQHPTRGLILPGSFIDIAEETGLLTPISQWTILAVCRQIRLWQQQERDGSILSSIVDGTLGRQLGDELQKAHDDLERVVKERTRELTRAIAQLTREVAVRKEAEQSLQAMKDRLQAENVYLQHEFDRQFNFGEMIGSSKALLQVFLQIEQVAPLDATVLLLGETGTGKGVVARAIHSRSSRKERQMIIVNCAALPAPLIESELFGREKGAFTGAHERQIGRFELANGGSIFLDEIGELPLELQGKLLRVIQDGEYERLGSPLSLRTDVRIIAASNRDLEKEVESGSFRRDLFYRLNVFPITMPPLRERPEDIPLLVNYFVAKFNQKTGKKMERVPKETMDALQGYGWPGNLRELESVIERAVITSTGSALRVMERFDSFRKPSEAAGGGGRALAELEQQHIFQTLLKTGWRINGSKGAALLLGLNPSTLRARIRKLGIVRPD